MKLAGLIYAGLFGISFTSTIGLGTLILSAVLGAASIITLGYGARWKAAAQVEHATAEAYRNQNQELKDALGLEKEHGQRLYHRLTDLAAERNELTVRIARLEERPDFVQIVEMVKAQSAEAEARTAMAVELLMNKIDERFEVADRRHEQRHSEVGQTLHRAAAALEQLAAREKGAT